MKSAANVLRVISTTLSVLSGWAIVLAGVIVVIDLVGRNMFNSPLPGSVAYGELALVAIVFLALPYAQRQGQHVSFEMLASSVSPRSAAVLTSVGLLAVLVPIAYVAFGSIQLAWSSFQRGEQLLGIVTVPAWPLRAFIAIGFSLLVLEIARTLFLSLRPLTRGQTHSEEGDSDVASLQIKGR